MIFTSMKNPSPAATILPFQPALCPALPVVLGNGDYHDFEARLHRIDQLLSLSGVETLFVAQCLARYDQQFPAATTKSAPPSVATAAPAPTTPAPAPTGLPPVAPAPSKEKTDDSSAKDTGSADSEDNGSEEGPSSQKETKRPILPIALGGLALVLLVGVVVLWSQVSSRDTDLQGNKNRMAQQQIEMDLLLRQIQTDKVELTKQKLESSTVRTEATQDRTALDKLKGETAELQLEAEKLRAMATDFETQMAQAQVTAIKRQGEVEIANTKTKVAITQLNNATAEAQLTEEQLTKARLEQAALQLKLDATERQLAFLQKTKVK